MTGSEDSGNKTEPATPKKLREARKRGDVPRSRELTSTLVLAFGMVLFTLSALYAADEIMRLADATLLLATRTTDAGHASGPEFGYRLQVLGQEAARLVVVLGALTLIPIVAFALLVDFLQAGPVFTLEKLMPKLSHLDPAAGVRRMFSADNAVELVKSIAKTALLALIGWLVVRSLLAELVLLPEREPLDLIEALATLLARLFGWTVGVFLSITLLDAAWQRYSFAKKMRMSIRDIRDELKASEGDPLLRSRRRQMHQEYASAGATDAAARASVLIVNPEHIAVAIDYDRERQPVPRVTAIGEDAVALAMRDLARRHQVPVLRNIRLARLLADRTEPGDHVPRDLFDVLAEVIAWARQISAEIAAQRGAAHAGDRKPPRAAPGEDLTEYPLGRPRAHTVD